MTQGLKKFSCFTVALALCFSHLHAQRVPVLDQIKLPHNYYFRELYIPQLTSGPSSVAWSPDGKFLVYSMSGSLWRQALGTETAEQLTDGEGYDYQPDWSPDGTRIIFARYNGSSIELMVLELETSTTSSLTRNKGVNLEPRWSPDGQFIAFVSTFDTGHLLLYKARITSAGISETECLTPDRTSSVKRYYYSPFDHAINPVWSRDGKLLYYISNREIGHGTGDIVSMNISNREPSEAILHEETAWQTRPDISPDGSRMVYSSYLGRNWHQLWLLPTMGGYPMPLTYGEYDNTSPRWSPDGKKIAFISNRDGNTSLWWVNAYDGEQQQIKQSDFRYLTPHLSFALRVQDESGNPLPARISITDSRGKFHGPQESWIHADDSRYPDHAAFESHYFHQEGQCKLTVPNGRLFIQASHGPEYDITKVEVEATTGSTSPVIITLKKLSLPANFVPGWSGDVHVHMNYGGHYRNTPDRLIQQARCENLNFVYNLVVNKEQRIPDLPYFSTTPDKASTRETMILHGQEFHTFFWRHLGLLHLNKHYLIPDYAGYPLTAVESLFPNNSFIADRAHEQNGLVGYVHPFDPSEIFPNQSSTLTSELPVDAALGKVDYYELMGFSDHKASEAVWYQLLNCGLHLPAAAGTDAMANYASLRGPVGLNRVYVKGQGDLDPSVFEAGLKQGKSFVTNGPRLGFKVGQANPGDSISIPSKGQRTHFAAILRSAIPVDHLEVILNGEVVASYGMKSPAKNADFTGTLNFKGPGWVLLRAWSNEAHADLPDSYAYASTNPIYIQIPGARVQSKVSGEYFLKWIDRLDAAARASTAYRNEEEKASVLADIAKARQFYQRCIQTATLH